ncbi:GNAT family N-acetyltransferase [Sphingosinicella sp. BN140058]|uniref:GNAT family N-acetyltransferase n=1 Tax=Sphingosinicella sp. BN140058 TaxID=1892855 RepID=UPI001012ABA4|nr:GNAT family N-acetyltransferase [Sphingosinicella sp. BN140058]QAY78422.1 N-acetyltransferase [Sphingosinicella sp. BN140058]
MSHDVVHNEAESRFELAVGGDKAIAVYRLEGDRYAFTHTEVPPELEGQGIASALIEGALAQVRARGMKIVPLCAFVRHYVETHADVQDLVA